MFLLLACSRLYTTSMYNTYRCTLLTYLRMKSSIAHMNTYLTYLTFLYLIVYSAIVKKEKKKEKEKRKMSSILRCSSRKHSKAECALGNE